MKIKYGFKKLICFVSSVLLSWNILAAPGILEDIPLNVSTNVQPNILFLLDDSGSMDWEVLKSTSAVNSVNTIFVNGTVLAADLNACTSGAFNFNFNAGGTLGVFLYGSSGNIDFSPDTNTFIGLSAGPDNFTCRITLVAPGQDDAAVSELLNLCRGYNVTAFDPEIAANGGYTHWAGVDQTATAYSNRSLATAYINPYFGNVAANIANATNLAEPVTDHFYFVWNDPIAAGGDGDEQYDDNECGDDFPTYDADSNGILSLAECTALGTTVCQPVATIPAGSITLDDGTTQSVDMQEQYANWYTYYRKREYVAKRALSEIIDDSVSRMGMATLHNNSVDGGGVGTIIQDMQNLSLKNTLMNSLFRVDSNNGTPLRRNLEQAGEYFREAGGAGGVGNLFGATPAHTGTLNATTPLLTANEGGSCQQNFAVVFSDGYWNGIGTDVPSVGNTDGPVASGGNTIWDGGTFADDFSNTLADVAMHYLEHDLSPVTLENDLNIVDQNQENTRINHQHLTTYTVAFGVDGTLTTNPNVADSSFTWPDPITNTQEERVDDIRHAAWNGRGEYLNASNPQSLINSLTSAIADIDDRTGTASAASISSGFISSATLIFQSTFNTFDWSGDLLAYRFDEDGVVNLDTSTDTVDVSGNTVTEIDALDAIWSAAERLGAASNSDRINRAIYSYNGRQGVSFDFPDDYEDLLDGSNTDTDTLSDEQIEELLENAPHSSSTVDATEIDENQDYGEQIVDYLKGDATNEVGAGGLELFRGRNNKYLNAIINASPQYVGPPNDIYPNLIEGVGSEYSTFKTTNATRTPVVYVGGNNGMLHAFNASLNPDASVPSAAGRELFAYVPGTLLENNLHTLAETDYSHLAYVDAT
ncbi:MAG: type IV pilus assembly protein PilY1, partial [Cellvibrionaceae bacterium]